MATKTISTYVAAGYTLSAAYSELIITSSGGIGGTGLLAGSYAQVFNDGVVNGQHGSNGIVLDAGGFVQNGAADVTGAVIVGRYGVFVTGGAGTVVNYATISTVNIRTRYGRDAVDLTSGGSVTNGAAGDTNATIVGYRNGIVSGGAANVTNFGTIDSAGNDGFGISLRTGTVTNGAAGLAGALIEGFQGVGVSGAETTVTNFGTIRGFGGAALSFGSASDVLVVEAGCAFTGAVLGGGGKLDLASGTGTLTGNLGGGAVTVSGSMAHTTFSDFNTVEIGAAATFATKGAVTIGAGQTLIDAGSLTLGGTKSGIVNDGTIETLGGTLTVNGAVTGTGQATIHSGTLYFVSAFNEAVTFSGKTGVLELAQSQAYTATVTGFSKSGGTSLDLADIGFVSAGEATFSGTKTGGVLTVSDGTHTAQINLLGNYLRSAFVAASDGHGGVIIHDPAPSAASLPPWAVGRSSQRFIAAMAGLGSSGGATVHTREPWAGREAMLSKPRAMIA